MKRMSLGLLLLAGCQGSEAPLAPSKPVAMVTHHQGNLPQALPLPDVLLSRRGSNSPAGTWRWLGGMGDQVEYTLTLRFEGKRLTGILSRAKGKGATIDDVSYEDGELSFTVTRERIGGVGTSRYVGRVMGQTIRGSFEFDISQGRKRDWEAQRVHD
jgi:hypothetical protein